MANITAHSTTTLATRWWLEPMALWGATRLVAVVAMYLGAALMPCSFDYRRVSPAAGEIEDLPTFYRRYAESPAALGRWPFVGLRVGGSWSALDPLVRWDAYWYLSIAEVGYVVETKHATQQNVAFFPAYPLAIRAFRFLGIPTIPAALLVSNVALAAAACLFYRFVARRNGVTVARWTVALWLLYPTSFFGSLPYSESLAALCAVFWLSEAIERRYVASGLWAGLASAVRPQGVLLGIPCLEGLVTRGRRREALVGLMVCGLGLAAYVAWLAWQFGNPLLFADVQRFWRPEASATWNPKRWLIVILAGLAFPVAAIVKDEPSLLVSSRVVDPWLLVWAAAWLPAVYRHFGWGLALSTCAMFVVPLATGELASFGRFTWLMLPVFLASGQALATHRARWIVAGVSALLLVWLSVLYGGY